MSKTFNEYKLKKGNYLTDKNVRILTLDSEILALLRAEAPLSEILSEPKEV